jgi:hypothetical protein
VRSNKKGLPRNYIFPATGKTRKARGTICCCKHAEKPFWFTFYMDIKPVLILSTWRPSLVQIQKNEKLAGGGYRPVKVTQPSVIASYNASMGGTDLCDQLYSYYDDRTRKIKWQSRIIIHFLRIACLNAKILYNFGKGNKFMFVFMYLIYLHMLFEFTLDSKDQLSKIRLCMIKQHTKNHGKSNRKFDFPVSILLKNANRFEKMMPQVKLAMFENVVRYASMQLPLFVVNVMCICVWDMRMRGGASKFFIRMKSCQNFSSCVTNLEINS